MRKIFTWACGIAAACALPLTAMAPASAAFVPAHGIVNATNACNSACTDVHFLVPGEHYLVKDHSALTTANNVIALAPASNSLPAEDFAEIQVGTVQPQYCLGSFAIPGSVFTSHQCQLLASAGLDGATTFELAFNPDNGGPETMCIGAWNNVSPVPSGYKMRLEPCGDSASTVMIETTHLPTGTTTAGSDWLINGGSDNFSNPLVATNNGGTAWQAPRWETVNVNGGSGQDTQEVRLESGPFTI